MIVKPDTNSLVIYLNGILDAIRAFQNTINFLSVAYPVGFYDLYPHLNQCAIEFKDTVNLALYRAESLDTVNMHTTNQKCNLDNISADEFKKLGEWLTKRMNNIDHMKRYVTEFEKKYQSQIGTKVYDISHPIMQEINTLKRTMTGVQSQWFRSYDLRTHKSP